jgi:predicted PurR-regulated permease PerM
MAIEDRIRKIGSVAWAVVGITVAVALLGLVIWFVRVIIPPLVLASVIVFLLNPMVTRLHRRGLPRVLGAALAYAGVVTGLVIIGLLLTPLVRSQADDLSERFPKIRRDVERQVDKWSRQSIRDGWPITIPRIRDLEDQASGNKKDFSAQVATLREIGVRAFHIGLIFVLGPIVAFYLLVDLPDVRRRTEALIPERSKPEVLFLGHRLNLVVGGFFRGQVAVAFIVGTMVSVGLFVLGLKAWLIVGMIAGVFNMIPLIGPYIGAIPGIVLALTTKDTKAAIGVVLIMVAAQQIDNHFVTPMVMKRAVHLHPAAVMMSLLAFGTIGGFFGLLIAVPVTAALKVVGGHLWRKYVLGVSLPGLDHPAPDDGDPPIDADAGAGNVAPA